MKSTVDKDYPWTFEGPEIYKCVVSFQNHKFNFEFIFSINFFFPNSILQLCFTRVVQLIGKKE